MKDALFALRSRKTEESRLKAQQAIEQWQKAIDDVAHAAKVAECQIDLPAELTAPLAHAATEIPSANYVEAVVIRSIAVQKRKSIVNLAKIQLREVINNRTNDKNGVEQEIKSAKSERDHVVALALREKDSHVADMESDAKESEGNGIFNTVIFVAIIWVIIPLTNGFSFFGFIGFVLAGAFCVPMISLALYFLIQAIVVGNRTKSEVIKYKKKGTTGFLVG